MLLVRESKNDGKLYVINVVDSIVNTDVSNWDISGVMFKDNMFNGSAYTGKSL